MKLTEHPCQQAHVIKHADRDILVNETRYTESLVITADDTLHPWAVSDKSDLSPETLTPLLAGDPEVVIIGMSEGAPGFPLEYLAFFLEKGTGVEVMSVPAAARTYNLLISDGRRAAVGLMLSG